MKFSGGNIYFSPLLLILIILVLQFVVNIKYTFPEPHAFRGEYLYNPYNGMDSTKWVKANFHAHTRLLLGLTDGAANTDQVLDSFYTYFDYGIIGISNYQKIDKFQDKDKKYVPVYEHGYQYHKNHQLVINAKKVSWLDFLFRQTLNNKQSVIDHLKKDKSVIVTIVHPDRRQSYPINDFKYLGNYNCLEIANNEQLFTSYYDTVLSSGHIVFILADDDTHDLANFNDGCKSFNMLCTDLVRDSILDAIKTGRLVGVNFKVSSYNSNAEKKAGLQKLPDIMSVTLKNDTITVRLNLSVKSIKFIGQKGVERMKITNAATGSYFFRKEDTYIRTEIECNDGSIYFFNPVFRYNGIQLTDCIPSPDIIKTWIWRMAFLVLLFLSFAIWRINISRNINKSGTTEN